MAAIMTTAASNKYNVHALRKELDSSARSRSWNRFRATLQSIAYGENSAALVRAVVLERPRSSRGVVTDHATLLHLLLQRCFGGEWKSAVRGGKRVPTDIIDTIAALVPDALCLQNPKSGRTPLHLAVYRDAPPPVVECLIRRDKSRRSLAILDRNGDTPLLVAVRKDDINFYRGIAGLLLRYDEDGTSLLISSRGEKRSPLLYVATNELSHSRCRDNDLSRMPDAVRLMLARTHDALKGAESSREGREVNEDIDTASAIRAAVACSDLLGGLSSDVLRILLREAEEEGKLTSALTERNDGGNTPLHLLCSGAEDEDRFRLIHMVYTSCPETLKCPNNDGDLPMSIAIRTVKPWQVIRPLSEAYPDVIRRRNNKGELPLHIALKVRENNVLRAFLTAWEIWRLWPEALMHRDDDTGMYPFQLPAASLSESQFQSDEDQLQGLRWAYFFLRQKPDVLMALLS